MEEIYEAVHRDVWIYKFSGRDRIYRMLNDRQKILSFKMPPRHLIKEFVEFMVTTDEKEGVLVHVRIPSVETAEDETGVHPESTLSWIAPFPKLTKKS